MKFIIPTSIETPRLKLRLFEEGDWKSLCVMFQDEECVRYTAGSRVADWLTWRLMAGYMGHWYFRGYGPYAVVEKSTGQMMGPVGLWYPGDWPEPEMKFSLARSFWGKGYAFEAASAVKTMVANDLKWKRLISLIHTENDTAKALARRLGGTYEKTIPFRDDRSDVFAYSIT